MKARGFSLLEALVTLVIITMIMAVLTQALVYVLGIHSRLLDHESRGRTALLHEQWFRESVSAALADRESGIGPFRGDGKGFSLLSAGALQSAAGARVAWRLVESEGGRTLEYVEEGNVTAMMVEGLEDAHFTYCDHKGRWHDRWPASEAPGEFLPRLVALHGEESGKSWTWWVAITASPELPPPLEVGFDTPSIAP